MGQVLDLRLEPVTIAMDPPAAQDFHDSLQNLFAQGRLDTCIMHYAVSAWFCMPQALHACLCLTEHSYVISASCLQTQFFVANHQQPTNQKRLELCKNTQAMLGGSQHPNLLSVGSAVPNASSAGTGIRQRSVTRHRHRQQEYTVWEPCFRNGLCRTGQYFVGRPASRRVAEHYEQSVYDLQPQHIKVRHALWIMACMGWKSVLHLVRSISMHQMQAISVFKLLCSKSPKLCVDVGRTALSGIPLLSYTGSWAAISASCPGAMQEYFIALVDGTIEASVKYVREYVHAYLSDMLEEARGQIQNYGQSFNTTMVAALKTRQQGMLCHKLLV